MAGIVDFYIILALKFEGRINKRVKEKFTEFTGPYYGLGVTNRRLYS